MKLSLRRRLLVSTIAAGAIFSAAPAWAQQAPAQDDAKPQDAGEVVVTGTLIRNPNLVSANPVSVVSEKEIQLRQSNTAEDLLRQLPGIVPNVGSAVNNGNGGFAFVDLRGLGPNRNLVLIDGVRLVPANLNGAFDLNNIPLALIQRVDTLTGGASTTYGADAIAGVINFVTKQDFSGVDLSVSEQVTGKGDGNTLRADLTIGANVDEGRGNVVFSVGYQKSDAVYQGDRDFSFFNIDSASGGAGGSGTSVPSRFSLPAGGGFGAGTFQINPATGGFNPTTAFQSFNFNPYNIFNTPFQRYNMYGAAHYELNDNLEVYTRGLFSKNQVDTIIAPSGAFALPVQISLNNPFLPTAARNEICARFAASTADFNPNQPGVQGLSPTNCAAAAAATGPTDPNYRQFGANLSRRAVEVGPRISSYTTTVFDYRLGFRGSITNNISWDLWGSYGESENVQVQQGYTLNSRVAQSLLTQTVNGQAQCQNQANGCIPIDWFGAQGSISPAASAFLTANANIAIRTTLTQAHGGFSGDFGVSSPFASDKISFAVAGEYRRYTATQQSDSLSVSGDLGGSGGASPNIRGGYDVFEGIGELAVPLVQDKPFAKLLEADGGVRYSSYTVNAPGAPKYDPITWAFRGKWKPIEKLLIRGTYSRSVRAPNVGELFNPQNTVLTNVNAQSDLCANVLDNGTVFRPAPTGTLRDVCIAQGAPAAAIGAIPVPTAGQANTTTGGNLNLRPEVSTSWTVGAVLTNPFPGFTLSVDYYNIRITGAITTPAVADILNACFNNPVVTNPACARTAIGRDPATGSLSGSPQTTPGLFAALSNLGLIETSGIDFSAQYRRNLGFGQLTLDFVGNWTETSKFQAVAGQGLFRECVGYYSNNCGSPGNPINPGSIQPEFTFSQRTTLSIDKMDFSLLWRYISPTSYEPGQGNLFSGQVASLNNATYNFNRIGAYHYFDWSMRYAVSEKLSLLFSIQNLFDRDPPLVGSTAGTTSFNSGNTFPSTYDPLGRRFAATARFRF